MNRTLLSLIIIGPILLGLTSCGPKVDMEERIRLGQLDWEKAIAIDNADSYFNFILISGWQRLRPSDSLSSYDPANHELAHSKFIKRLKEERKIEFSITKSRNTSHLPIERDLSFLTYLCGLKNAEINLSTTGRLKSEKYIVKNGNWWQKGEKIDSGGTLQGSIEIKNKESGAVLFSKDFQFNQTPLQEFSASFEPTPIKTLYNWDVVPMLTDIFSSFHQNRIGYLFEVSEKMPYLSKSARELLLQPTIADELRKSNNLNYVIDVLQNNTFPANRFLAAYVLSYSKDPRAVESLIGSLNDRGIANPGKMAEFRVNFAVEKSLGNIGEHAVPALLSELKKINNQLNELPSNASKDFDSIYKKLKRKKKSIIYIFSRDMPKEYAIELFIPFLSLPDSSANFFKKAFFTAPIDKSPSNWAKNVLKEKTGKDFGKDIKAWNEWWLDEKKNIKPQERKANDDKTENMTQRELAREKFIAVEYLPE